MSKKSDSFKLGLLIIIGSLLFLLMVVILGAGNMFETTIDMETYVNESINGLDVGAPVKLRGVQIGRVTEISFVNKIYEQAKDSDYRYVYILCELREDLLPMKERPEADLEEATAREVDKGLRVRPSTMGLTGQMFIEIDYLDPKNNQPLPIDWKPEELYIPSVPSTMSRVEAAITTISNTLSKVDKADIHEVIQNIKSVSKSLDSFLRQADAKGIGERVKGILQQGENVLARVDKLLNAPETAEVIPNVNGLLKSARHISEQSSGDAVQSIHKLNAAMDHVQRIATTLDDYLNGPEGKKSLKNLSGTLANLGEASVEAKAAAAKLNTTISRVNGLIAAQQINIQTILENTRILMENLKEISGEARRNPSGVLFGAPPRKTEPER